MTKRSMPAYPLFVKDPYFSFWAKTEFLPEEHVIFWTGKERSLYGFLRCADKLYCFLGNAEGVEKAEQLDLSVTSFTTDYKFRAGKAELSVSFVSPLLPEDNSLLSCPVCYMNYQVSGAENCEVIFAVGQDICSNAQAPVCGACAATEDFETAFFGRRHQLLFCEQGDMVCADWGYWYLTGERASFVDGKALSDCIGWGGIYSEKKFLLSRNRQACGTVMLAFDDVASINYFGDFLKGYYLSEHTIFEALEETFRSRKEIDGRLAAFDEALCAQAEKYGKDYYNILTASLRQSIGAHKLVKDRKGNLLFLSKECGSNGCIATVDVSYPSAPLFLKYNPELLRGMLRPVFEFAKNPVWEYDFAPHDVGVYPCCCGQVYGFAGNTQYASLFSRGAEQSVFPVYVLPATAKIFNDGSQMPVEECANMIILTTACYKADDQIGQAQDNFPLLKKWADYLVENGLHPENQLCTDDFSGHLADNLNLAIKATVGIGCFAELLKALGRKEDADKYRKVAERYAAEITGLGQRGPLPLTWKEDNTYSLKYNFAFDRLLGLRLFPQELLERETREYLDRRQAFGIPLDGRSAYAKTDWTIWTASLTEVSEKQREFLACVDKYLREGSERLPFGDWYDAVTGKLIEFRNRSVQGGCFILLLEEELCEGREL